MSHNQCARMKTSDQPNSALPGQAPFINLWRLLAAGAVVFALTLPALLFLRKGADDSISPARLLDTPPSGAARVGLDTGKLAPDFEISTPDGERVRLSNLRGRPVLINFWARWCGSCLSEMPEIKALQEERGLDSFTVLAVNAGETRAEALQFIDFLKAPFIYGLDSQLTIADAYGVYGLPLSVFIDADGAVRGVHRGHADRARLEALVGAAAAAGSPPELPVQVRLISTIPRERVLLVERKAANELVFSSRGLRCDASYCAEDAVEVFSRSGGIVSTDITSRKGEPRLQIRFDRGNVTPDEIIDRLKTTLEALPDPVYSQPLEIRYKHP
jgi:thiol-disulfide isomerase/thioredoxin